MTGEPLRDRWARLAGTGPAAEAAGADLLRRYAEPQRRYHDTTHLRDVLERVEELAGEATDVDAVRLAAWFHDAVYDPTAADNEDRSASLAEQALPPLGVPADRVVEVARLVRLTATHALADTGTAADRNAAVLCDADLAILAASPERYAAYAAAVREEYGFVDEQTFRSGRAAVLRGLLAAPALFRTRAGRAAYEDRARHNMATELSLLEASAPS